MKHAVKRIDNNYPNLKSLKNALLFNLTSLFLHQGNEGVAEKYINDSMLLSQNLNRFDLVYINRIRLALIKHDASKLADTLHQLKGLGDENLYQGMLKEIQNYDNRYQ